MVGWRCRVIGGSQRKIPMARRQLFTSDLKCPVCGKQGTAKWQEDETPLEHRGDLRRKLVSVSRGFYIEVGHNKYDEPRIFCSRCHYLVLS